VSAAFGRRVKTVRPKLSLGAHHDLLGLASPRVGMRVRVADTGSVRLVEIVQSSGSSLVDQACQLAMYDWWFEPPKDAQGRPLEADLRWTITFRYR
jgi:TonB family protein